MNNSFGVRKAVPADEQRIFDHLMVLHGENGLAPVSEKKVRVEIARATRTQGNIIGLIDGPEGGGIEASIGMKLATFWYTDKFHWEELWIFVHPQFRRSTHAKRLIGFAKWCRDEMSRAAGEDVNLFVGILTLKALEPKLRLYQRNFPQVGALFAYGPVPNETFNQRHLGNGKA